MVDRARGVFLVPLDPPAPMLHPLPAYVPAVRVPPPGRRGESLSGVGGALPFPPACPIHLGHTDGFVYTIASGMHYVHAALAGLSVGVFEHTPGKCTDGQFGLVAVHHIDRGSLTEDRMSTTSSPRDGGLAPPPRGASRSPANRARPLTSLPQMDTAPPPEHESALPLVVGKQDRRSALHCESSPISLLIYSTHKSPGCSPSPSPRNSVFLRHLHSAAILPLR